MSKASASLSKYLNLLLNFFSKAKEKSAAWFDPITCQMRLNHMQTLNIVKIRMTLGLSYQNS